MLVADEIVALAKAGYGADALARWRTQHELMICAPFQDDPGIGSAGEHGSDAVRVGGPFGGLRGRGHEPDDRGERP
jgi:hypothetical protein